MTAAELGQGNFLTINRNPRTPKPHTGMCKDESRTQKTPGQHAEDSSPGRGAGAEGKGGVCWRAGLQGCSQVWWGQTLRPFWRGGILIKKKTTNAN